jgi:hypothetical protein
MLLGALMQIRDDNLLGPLDPARVQEFERRHSVDLPTDYKSFLLEHHGGVPNPAFFWVNGPLDSFQTMVQSFYGLCRPGYNAAAWWGAEEIPPHLLVIGDDGCCGCAGSAEIGILRGSG